MTNLSNAVPTDANSVGLAIIADAKSHLGDNNASHYLLPGSGDAAWCGDFVTEELNKFFPGIPPMHNLVDIVAFADRNNLYHQKEDGYVPKKGDLVFLKLPYDDRLINHVAIVDYADSDGVHTVDGHVIGGVAQEKWSWSEVVSFMDTTGKGSGKFVPGNLAANREGSQASSSASQSEVTKLLAQFTQLIQLTQQMQQVQQMQRIFSSTMGMIRGVGSNMFGGGGGGGMSDMFGGGGGMDFMNPMMSLMPLLMMAPLMSELSKLASSGDPTLSASPDKKGVMDTIVNEAKRLGVDPALALAIGDQESGFNPTDVNHGDPGGSYGAMQVNKGAHPDFDVQQAMHGGPGGGPDVAYQIKKGMEILKGYLNDTGGDVSAAVYRYNHSSAYVHDVLSKMSKYAGTAQPVAANA